MQQAIVSRKNPCSYSGLGIDESVLATSSREGLGTLSRKVTLIPQNRNTYYPRVVYVEPMSSNVYTAVDRRAGAELQKAAGRNFRVAGYQLGALERPLLQRLFSLDQNLEMSSFFFAHFAK